MKRSAFKDALTLRAPLGLGAAVAATATLWGGAALGAVTLAVLALDVLLLSLLGRFLSPGMKPAVSVLFGAGLASLAGTALSALGYALSVSLGLWVPLVAASGLLVVYAPAASAAPAGRAAAQGRAAGLGYLLLLALVGAVRELLGFASLGGLALGFGPLALISTPFGGFLVLGLVLALLRGLTGGKDEDEKEAEE